MKKKTYNNPLIFKLEFFIILVASFLLIYLSLKFIAFCNKSWQLLQRYGSYLKPIKKYK